MDKLYDVIVVGAGTAGIALTIFAAPRGARVLVLDAADRIGGTLYYSSGQMTGAGTKLQARKGIADDPDIHYADIMRISHGDADPALTRLATRIAGSTIDWITDLGAEFVPQCPVVHFGHEPYSVARTCWGVDNAKSYLKVLQPVFERTVRDHDVTLLMSTRMTSILRSASGEVVGVEVERGGAREPLHGKNVVLTTGGYGSNAALFRKLTDNRPLFTMTAPTSNGSGIEAALAAGGVLRGQEHFLPTFGGIGVAGDPIRIEPSYSMEFPVQVRAPWEIFVNLDGKRFIPEDSESVDQKEHALLKQKEMSFWVIFDERIYREAPWFFRRKLREEIDADWNVHPSFKRAATIGDLAKACDLPEPALRTTVEDYNRGQADGNDALGRTFLPASIAKPPFYAILNHGTVARTFAGVRINDRLQIVDDRDRPIPNLYAAGEIIGASTFAGMSFAGGMSITPALGFGRLLGEELLKW